MYCMVVGSVTEPLWLGSISSRTTTAPIDRPLDAAELFFGGHAF
jgi:hypothetical protein